MSSVVSENCNLNSGQPITSQPQLHQIPHLNNNKQLNFSHQPSSSNYVGTHMSNSQSLNDKNQKNTQTNPSYRKIFIQRDYSDGTSVRFQNKFPEELEGYIERQHFDYLITTLNYYYDKAESANLSTFCEGFCACLTAYIIYICMESHYEKYMKKTKEYINEQNDKVWKPRGLYVTDPIDRGLRIIEITIGPKAQQKEMIGNNLKKD